MQTMQDCSLRSYLDLDIDKLLALSAVSARRARALKPQPVLASPIILTGQCLNVPPCLHCKWEHFKAEGKPSFTQQASTQQLINWAHALANDGRQRAFFATGWLGYRLPSSLLETIEEVCHAEPRLEYFGLFGALDQQAHFDLARVGLSGMLTSLESPSPQVYRWFRPGGDSLDDRLRSFDYAHEAGLKLWTGFLVNLGETLDDIAVGIEKLKELQPDSVSILPFIPFPNTPLQDHPAPGPELLVKANAVARIALPPQTLLFTDHYLDVDRNYGKALGFTGSYEVKPLGEVIE